LPKPELHSTTPKTQADPDTNDEERKSEPPSVHLLESDFLVVVDSDVVEFVGTSYPFTVTVLLPIGFVGFRIHFDVASIP